MVAISLFLAVFAGASSAVVAAPTTSALRVPCVDPKAVLCKLPFINQHLCPRGGTSDGKTVKTTLGNAAGVLDEEGAYRFTVKYANAARWKDSTLATTWKIPNGFADSKAAPLACPQRELESSAFSEDCLSIVIYTPRAVPLTGLPVMVWFHGGSFLVGSASGAGLNGSKFATQTNTIVAVVQYRLGALGFMAPDGTQNLAVKDSINALKFLKTHLASFGGDVNKITIAGQSSGAHMVRTLLATPSASSLFKQGILQSDTMNAAFQKPSTQTTLLQYFTSSTGCTNAACYNSLSLSAIINAEMDLTSNAIGLDPAAGNAEAIRPVLDGTLITKAMTASNKFPATNKPLLITTVKDEAGSAIYGNIDFPLPEVVFGNNVDDTFGPERAATILSSPYYPAVLFEGEVDARGQLEKLGTDYLWKCSSWTFARSYAQNGGSAFVGMYTLGATYPSNDGIPFCADGKICHQDDIQIVFGTVPYPSPAQATLITEMQKRYKAFLYNGTPNAAGLSTWAPSTSTDIRVQNLGGVGTVETGGACGVNFWGSAVQYDYQFYSA